MHLLEARRNRADDDDGGLSANTLRQQPFLCNEVTVKDSHSSDTPTDTSDEGPKARAARNLPGA